MKQFKWRKLAAVLLVVCLSVGMVTPASAAGLFSSGRSSSLLGSLTDRWNNLWNSIFGGAQEEEPAEDAGNTETESGDLTLVEDETTVTEGTDLRASTYSLELLAGREEDLKYFPVTLYNYDTTGVNNATHQLEVDTGLKDEWEGIYFSKGNPGAVNDHGAETDISKTYSYTDPNGKETYKKNTVYYDRYSSYSQYTNGNYYYKNDSNYIEVTHLSCEHRLFSSTYTWSINNGQHTISGNPLTLYTKTTSSQTSVTKPYADWNFWTGNLRGATGNYIYSGIVQSQLSADKSIVFNHLEPGLFTSDQASWKDVYYNVGLPFKYDSAALSYTFDSSDMAAHFTDGAASYKNLTYGDTPQSNNTAYADGSTTVWMPFNSKVTIDGEENCDYHFGMQATIPFTMTTDGLISSTNQTPITFDFSGDDDVWVFIDGKLVLDLGGIHNSMGGSLNFADNTWKITIGEGNTQKNVNVGDAAGNYEAYNSSGNSWRTKDTISGQLFNDDDGQGVLNMTRETFAATEEHTLTIYYLERGGGSSNCKIKFNLPMKDQVTVQKQVSTVDSANQPLDQDTLEALNNRNFTFVLYHGDKPVTNATYLLYDTDGTYLQSPSTTSSGEFSLKNGQTAKFISEISADGSSYHVVETTPGTDWATPTWTQKTVAANGFSGEQTSTALTSMTVTANGSEEAVDTIAFVCKNTVIHQVKTNLEVNPDSIVIDYGLPVQIDVLDNDVPYGGTLSVTGVSGAQYGNAKVENNKIVYTLKRQLTDVEELTYTVKLTASSGVEGDNKTATGTIYIIPATTMYYEEDFTDLVTFSDGWTPESTSTKNATQEPGVVGTVGDSPYGSDVAYLNDSGDSNGTSMYVSTANTVAQFSYTFTGTGTSFFARTTNNTAYMRVVVSKDGEKVYELMRDTSYKTEDDGTTLYNIPVFTYMAENYGIYTVTVTLANASIATGYGSNFWLDGIRVYNPMDKDSDQYSTATGAYAQDGEANMTNVTLREKLLRDATKDDETGGLVWDGENFVIFTDTDGAIATASEYQSKGPKEEVYLDDGQSVTFSLKNWDVNSNKIYLGIKAPMGGGSVSINSRDPITISNTCDCYYDISDYVTLSGKTATFKIVASNAVISVTNIKVTGNAEFTIVNGDTVSVDGSEIDMP